jgi:uncharacterized protein (UPF0276 family)
MMHAQTLPPRAGVGLKPCHYHAAVSEPGAVGWFEVHAENYMGAGGAPHHYLERIRRDHPLSLHGVGLSIGSDEGPDPEHLTRLAALERRYQPASVSEHLAWSALHGQFLADLLPVPYDDQTLDRVCDHVSLVQDTLRRPVLIENPSTYVAFRDDTMTEGAFLGSLCRRTGCGLLLDVSNVYVSATNHGRDAYADLAALPVHRAAEIHLAGYAVDTSGAGHPLLIDSHDRAVSGEVWALYARALELAGPVPTLIEWDRDTPPWSTLVAEAHAAEARMAACESDPIRVRAR